MVIDNLILMLLGLGLLLGALCIAGLLVSFFGSIADDGIPRGPHRPTW